ncbi:MAG: hypothetical protein CFE50_03785 [Pseudomonas sp. PGPPP4]|nr:MAG: hypothetical protein CFE50_03785 [Pseudomonas sp. PGPPP4]
MVDFSEAVSGYVGGKGEAGAGKIDSGYVGTRGRTLTVKLFIGVSGAAPGEAGRYRQTSISQGAP